LPYRAASDSVYAGYYAWYGKNSSGTTRKVATRLPNLLGIYDLAGNVFEWTNDWKGIYEGKDIVNSLGRFQPEGEYEKVVKGGAYNYSLVYLRPSRRSVMYAAILSTVNEYVGFRCARGIINNGQYISIEQQSFTTNPVTITASAGDFRTFIGTADLKLVFVNVSEESRTLCCIDFGKTLPVCREFLDDRNVHMPVVSPDGHYVAYCSSGEGRSGPSEVSIRSIDLMNSTIIKLDSTPAYIPRWWVPRDFSWMTYLVYTNSAVENGNSLWPSTKTFTQWIGTDGRPADAARELIADGSYHDGLSIDGRYALTGFNRLIVREIGTGLNTQLFVSPGNGKDAEGSTQVCNVSMSPDTGDRIRCMFLDFGYPRTSTVVGGSYGVHEYLFVSTLSGTITSHINRPPGEQSWDYPEWSTKSQFAVACGRNSAEQAHAIYAINLDNKNFQRVATGEELHEPFLWIGFLVPNPSNLALDSIGAYNDPPVSSMQKDFAVKMHLFWKSRGEFELVFMGNSLVYCGVDCSAFKHFKAFNMGFTGCGTYAESLIISNYVLPHTPKVKLIGFNLPMYDFGKPLGRPNADDFYVMGMGQSKGYNYDMSHNFWIDSMPAGFEGVIQQAPFPPLEETGWDSLGLLHSSCNGWGGPNPDLSGDVCWTVNDSDYLNNFAEFVDLIEMISSRQVHVLAIIFPESPFYKNTDHYLRAGPSWETGKAVIAQVESLQNQYPYFHVYDAYNDGDHDYADEDAMNWNHLCLSGARKLTLRLDTLIDSILNR
jgi:hypothetical protein